MADNEINVQLTASLSELKAGMTQGADIVKDQTGKMTDAVMGLKSSTEAVASGIRSAFAGFASLLGGGMIIESLRSLVNKTVEFSEQLERMKLQTGMSEYELMKFKTAAESVGSNIETVSMSFRFLGRNIDSAKAGIGPAADAFRAMGLDVNKMGTDMQADFERIADKFAGYEDGANKIALATAIFGRAGYELIPILNQGGTGIEQFGSKMGMTQKQVEDMTNASKAYHAETVLVDAQIEGMRNRIVTGILPALTDFISGISQSDTVVGAITWTLKALILTLETVKAAFEILFKSVVTWVQNAWDGIRMLGKGVEDLWGMITGKKHFSDLRDDWNAIYDTIVQRTQQTDAEIAKIADHLGTVMEKFRMQATGQAPLVEAGTTTGGPKTAAPGAHAGGATPDESWNDEMKKGYMVMLDYETAMDGIQEKFKSLGEIAKPLFSDFNRSFTGMVTGAMTVQQAFAKMAQSIVSSLIEMGLKTLEEQLMNNLLQKAENAAMAESNIALAASSAAASAGPAAPAVAAETEATLTSMLMPQIFAAGGYDVPFDTVAQIHRREMVLPAELADRVRGMTGGEGGTGGGDIHLHFNGPADARGIRDWFKQNGHNIVTSLRGQARNFKQ